MSPTQKKMTHLARRVLLLITVIIIVAFPCFSQGQAKDDKYWALSEKYCNARFGFCVSYPASLVMRDPPANDDGKGKPLVITDQIVSRYIPENGGRMKIDTVKTAKYGKLTVANWWKQVRAKSTMAQLREKYDKLIEEYTVTP